MSIPALPIETADGLDALRDVIGAARLVGIGETAVPTITPLPPDER